MSEKEGDKIMRTIKTPNVIFAQKLLIISVRTVDR